MSLRKIDALVSEHIMGYLAEFYEDYEGMPNIWIETYKLGSGNTRDLPNYSTDIEAAWEAVEKLRKEDVTLYIVDNPQGQSVGFYFDYIGNRPRKEVTVFNDDTPLAICLAALKVKGINDV